jgi:hypothetical protein
MELILYKTSSDKNVINKELTEPTSLDIKLKRDELIESPRISCNRFEGIESYNYAYIPKFERYYFIVDVEILNKKISRLRLHTDVLETYKNDILNSTVRVSVAEIDSYVDVELSHDVRLKINKLMLENSDFKDSESYILTTIGG